MTAPMVVEGAMTGEMFLGYIEQCLVPTHRPDDILVMNNFRAHMFLAFGRRSRRRGRPFTDILDACQEAWQKLLNETGRIASIATRDWAIIGQSI
jgi:hypothetical protein